MVMEPERSAHVPQLVAGAQPAHQAAAAQQWDRLVAVTDDPLCRPGRGPGERERHVEPLASERGSQSGDLRGGGVDQHSDFRTDPIGRLNRTVAYVLATTFGSTADETC